MKKGIAYATARRWDDAHAADTEESSNTPAAKAAVPSHLYTDENPATTIKGTGFKNKFIAQRTIELTSQPGARYKQYWTIRAMRERAAHHPHPTEGMGDATAVFDKWLSNYKEPTEKEKEEQREEWEIHRLLCNSDANQHSYGKDPKATELNRARNDILEGQRLLYEVLTKKNRPESSTTFPLSSFVGLFGGPGLHGYGKHTIDTENCTSQVDLGIEGIEELLGSAKTRKLTLTSSSEIRVHYHRKKESASIILQQNGTTSNPTLEDLWRRTNKRQKRQGNGYTFHDETDTSFWTCSTCTLIHAGKAKIDYLVCEVCGSGRSNTTNE